MNMKTSTLFIVVASLFCCAPLHSQTNRPTAKADSSEFHTVQIQASFPGGDAAWIRFLQANLRADVPVRKKAPAGIYTVILSFLVAKDGTVYEIKLEEDPGYGTGKEALRVFKKAPRWNPAIQDGKPVIYRQKQSISFQVVEEEDVKKKKG